MRFGLLALSMAMLMSGGVAVQSAMAISTSATAAISQPPFAQGPAEGEKYGSLPFTAGRSAATRLAMR